MTKSYHINKHGVPAPCHAKPGNCPLGNNEQHFSNEEDAQSFINKKLSQEYGHLPGVKERISIGYMKSLSDRRIVSFRNASTDRDHEYIEEKKDYLASLGGKGGDPYINKCKHSIRDDKYTPKEKTTKHYARDRKKRRKILNRDLDEGGVIGYYKVNHLNSNYNEYVSQVVELRESGLMTIYNEDDELITKFVATPARVETTMILAGDIPSKEFLDVVRDNRKKFRNI